MRRHRERRRKGLRSLTLELRAEVNELVRRGYLARDGRNDVTRSWWREPQRVTQLIILPKPLQFVVTGVRASERLPSFASDMN
jgi:hypothetical protein